MGIIPAESFVIIYHRDMQAAQQFYEGVLGLAIREITYDWFIGYWVSGKHEMTLCHTHWLCLSVFGSAPQRGAGTSKGDRGHGRNENHRDQL